MRHFQHTGPTETLTSADIPTVASANVAFGSDTSLVVARPGKPCCSFPLFWFTVPEGFYALVTRHGALELYSPAAAGDAGGGKGGGKATPSPVWPPGLHLGPPWLRVSHLVTKQSIVFDTRVRGCKTKDNVTVNIDIAIVLRIMGDADRDGDDPWNVYRFVHEVTARGLQQQLADAQAEAVRTLARSVLHTEVFGLRNIGRGELVGIRSGLYGTSVAPAAPGFSGGGGEGGLSSGRAAVDALKDMGMGMGVILEGAEESKNDIVPPGDEELGEVGLRAVGGASSSSSSAGKRPSHNRRSRSRLRSRQGEAKGRGGEYKKDGSGDEDDEDGGDDEEDKDLLGTHDEYDPLEAGFNAETGATVTEAMRERLNRQFKPQGVEILDVIVQQISLPDDIQAQMSQKTMVISQNAEQRMQQKHDLQVLRQTEAIKTLKQSIDERKLELKKDGELTALREQMELRRELAAGEAVQWNVSTQMAADVSLVEAESALTVRRLWDSTRLETERVAKEAEAKASMHRCEAEAKVRETEAEAERKCAELQAKGDKAIFHAEGISAPKNRTLHDHTTSLLRLRAQDALASNDRLVVTGTSGGKAANRLLLADAALSDLPGRRLVGGGGGPGVVIGEKEERAAFLSEMAFVSGRAGIRLHVGVGGGGVVGSSD